MKPCVIYIMGVSGSGKTTIGLRLSEGIGIPFFDADDFHPAANKEKMKAGKPLEDADRQGWLESLNALAKNEGKKAGAIIACSALKERYRDILAAGITVPVHWIFLEGNFSLIQERMKARKEHFMPPALLQSQFETLEQPHDAIVADIAKSPAEIVDDIIRHLDHDK